MWATLFNGKRFLLIFFQRFFKRAFDIGFTLVSVVVLFPLACIVGVLIFIESPGAILYRSERIGEGGKRFILYKFRTMVPDAHVLGPALTHRGDPRITRVGRFLRNTKFDEFPQVINVLKGEMSIVGPRPECPEYVVLYSRQQREVLRVKPGFTSLAQVVYYNEESVLPQQDAESFYINEVLPRKLGLDLYYVQNYSLLLDIKVFILGLLALLKIPPPSLLWRLTGRDTL